MPFSKADSFDIVTLQRVFKNNTKIMRGVVNVLRIGTGKLIFSLGLFLASPSLVWAAPIDCTGSSTGAAGTCSTIAGCSGTAETPVTASSGGPIVAVCPQDWICCIASDAGTDPIKPPKTIDPLPPVDPIDPLPPTDPGDNPGVCVGTCRLASQGCTAPEQPSSSGSCGVGTNQVCCVMPSSGAQNECEIAGGVCRTAGSGCIAPETPSLRSCGISTSQVCCDMPSGGPGTTGTGTGVTGSECTGEKIGGVCFPTGTGLSDKSVLDIISALIGWLLAIFGFIALIGFIISGLQYLTAAGDEGQAETAKRNMQYSIIGIIVALSGFIVIKAVDTLLNANPWI